MITSSMQALLHVLFLLLLPLCLPLLFHVKSWPFPSLFVAFSLGSVLLQYLVQLTPQLLYWWLYSNKKPCKLFIFRFMIFIFSMYVFIHIHSMPPAAHKMLHGFILFLANSSSLRAILILFACYTDLNLSIHHKLQFLSPYHKKEKAIMVNIPIFFSSFPYLF